MANTDFVMGSNIDLVGVYQLIGAILEKRTSDPGSPGQGQIWVRTDTSPPKVKWYDGTSVQVFADLASVVNAITAADSTITIGGTSTNPTVKVAKALDHTYITDFDTQVRTSRIDQMAAPTTDVSWNNFKVVNLADPTSAQDAVNLRTLQSYVNGLSDKDEVYYVTTAPLPTNTYANGTSGLGATLTGNANGALSIDGQAVVAGDPVMIANEVASANNGIYTVTQAGDASHTYILTRRTDFDQAAEIRTGLLVPVKVPTGRTGGTQNNTIWISAVASAVTVGTTAIAFSLIGNAYSAGTGITLTGTTFSLPTVTIALGGTNATTAAGARTNLVVPTQTSQTIGDGTSTSFVFTHNLNDSTPIVKVTRLSDGATINCGVRATSANAVTVTAGTSAAPIGSNTHKITVIALEGTG